MNPCKLQFKMHLNFEDLQRKNENCSLDDLYT